MQVADVPDIEDKRVSIWLGQQCHNTVHDEFRGQEPHGALQFDYFDSVP